MNEIANYLSFLFPVYFVALWCFILWILSSAWRRLATYYHHPQEFQGEILRFRSAIINFAKYNGILNLGMNRRGLYLVPMAIFRPFHKPILIPWEEIVAQPFKRFLYHGYQLQCRSVPGVRIVLYPDTFQRIVDYLKRNTGFKLDY
jgi:hypothetical protein